MKVTKQGCEVMNDVKRDFDYYQRTIEGMYRGYYLKRIGITSVVLAIILIYSVIMRESLLLNGILLVLLFVLLGYYLYQLMQFKQIYQKFETELIASQQIEKIEEDEFSYNVLSNSEAKFKINKNGARNLPAENKQYTLLVGFAKGMIVRQPLVIVYYDILDLKYEEKYRLKRNGYSRVPRFLRRYTWSNLKTSTGNLFRFFLSNIFMLYLLYRLIRYVWALIRMWM